MAHSTTVARADAVTALATLAGQPVRTLMAWTVVDGPDSTHALLSLLICAEV